MGGHVPTLNEGTVESVKCLFMALGKAIGQVNLEYQMAGKLPNIVSLDRGYVNKEVLKVLVLYGCSLVGTLKRCPLSPFVYGDTKK